MQEKAANFLRQQPFNKPGAGGVLSLWPMDISLQRVYKAPPRRRGEGVRVLVDRLWPRGVAKSAAPWGEWDRDVAPSTQLRRWYAHDPAKWNEFCARYRRELDAHPAAVDRLLQLADKETLTLMYAARDTEHNEAAALRDYLYERALNSSGGKIDFRPLANFPPPTPSP